MPRRHIRTYRGPKAVRKEEPNDRRPLRELPPIDYRRVVAVIGLVVFGLAAIAFLLTLRSRG
jgi:hypothetical protein